MKPDVLESLPGLYQRTEKGCLHSYCYCPDESNWMWTTKEQIVEDQDFNAFYTVLASWDRKLLGNK